MKMERRVAWFAVVMLSSICDDIWAADVVLTGEMRVKLQTLYNNLKSVETGYEQTCDPEGDGGAGESTATDDAAGDVRLLTAIEQRYVDLKCGYIYSSLLHMKMVRAYILKGGVHKDAFFGLFFEKQVALMLATLYNSQIRKSAAELWLLFVHMEQLRDHFRSDDRRRAEAGPAVAKVHFALAGHLRTLTKRFCKPDNEFNHRHRGSRFHRRFDIAEADRFQKQFYTEEHFIDMNRDMIERQIAFNRLKHGVRTDGSEHFTIRTLCLNGVMVDEYRMGKLKRMAAAAGLDDAKIFDRLTSDYERARANRWPDVQIKLLGRVHADFVDSLTVVVLRAVWKHVTYISQLIDFQSVSLSMCMTLLVLPFHNMNVSKQLAEFLRFFDMADDRSFDELVELLGSPVRNVFVKNNAALIADEIKKLLEKMSGKYKPRVDVTEPVSCDDDDPSKDIVIQYYNKANAVEATPSKNDLSYWFNVSVARIEYFVEYVTWILRGIDFKIINYFTSVSNELQLIPKNADNDLAKSSEQQK